MKHCFISLPLFQFIGEEASAAFGTADLTDDPTWIVDPLDGTTNFVHGYFVEGFFSERFVCSCSYLISHVAHFMTCRFPFVCISIGLAIGKVPTVGVVYNPIMNEVRMGLMFCFYFL